MSKKQYLQKLNFKLKNRKILMEDEIGAELAVFNTRESMIVQRGKFVKLKLGAVQRGEAVSIGNKS